jgi:hypothetical protein
MTAPFETFLVFSTNLNPSVLGDEAFLRRIQYKLLLHSPSEDEFSQIFQRACAARHLPCAPGLLSRFLDKRFRRTGKPLRRCQPRDLLFHALNLIHFEKLPNALNDEILDRAFESCFVEDQETAAPLSSSAPHPSAVFVAQPFAAADLAAQVSKIHSVFGRLCFLAEHRDESAPGEDARTRSHLHLQAFQDWLGLTLEQQSHDLTCYTSADANWAKFSGDRAGFIERLTPVGFLKAEADLFAYGLNTLLDICSLNAVAGLAAA